MVWDTGFIMDFSVTQHWRFIMSASAPDRRSGGYPEVDSLGSSSTLGYASR